MRFFTYGDLRERLASRTVSEREALPYFMGYLLITLIVPYVNDDKLESWDYLGGLIELTLTTAGLLYCYFKNGGNAGHDFIVRSFILGWVLGFRLFAVFIPVTFGILATLEFAGLEAAISDDISERVFVAIGLLLVYGRLGAQLARVRRLEQSCFRSQSDNDSSYLSA